MKMFQVLSIMLFAGVVLGKDDSNTVAPSGTTGATTVSGVVTSSTQVSNDTLTTPGAATTPATTELVQNATTTEPVPTTVLVGNFTSSSEFPTPFSTEKALDNSTMNATTVPPVQHNVTTDLPVTASTEVTPTSNLPNNSTSSATEQPASHLDSNSSVATTTTEKLRPSELPLIPIGNVSDASPNVTTPTAPPPTPSSPATGVSDTTAEGTVPPPTNNIGEGPGDYPVIHFPLPSMEPGSSVANFVPFKINIPNIPNIPNFKFNN